MRLSALAPRPLYRRDADRQSFGDLSPRAADTLRAGGPDPGRGQAGHRQAARPCRREGADADLSRPQRARPSASAIVARLGDEAVALVSDAGTPLISDPGYKLVRDARAAGHAVHTLPGPCAAIAALTLAGLPTDRFLFLGFLPAKAKARGDAIAEVARVRATLVFYESGPRLGDTLAALRDGLGERDAAVVREISKLHEEMRHRHACRACRALRRRAAQGRDRDRRRPAGRAAQAASDEELDAALARRCRALSPSRAAAEVAEQLGVPAEARLRPRARTARSEPRSRPSSAAAAPRRSPPGGCACRAGGSSPGGRACPAARSTSSPGAAGPRLRRGQGARDRTRPPALRSTNSGCAGSPPRPSGSRRATARPGDDIRIDAIFIVPRRCPRHLANIWHG